MSEAVGKVIDAESIVEGDACDAVEDAGEVAQIELLSVPRVNSNQLQSLSCLFVNQFVPNERRGQTSCDIESLSVSEHILNASFLDDLSVLLHRVDLDTALLSNFLPRNFLFGYFLRKRSR